MGINEVFSIWCLVFRALRLGPCMVCGFPVSGALLLATVSGLGEAPSSSLAKLHSDAKSGVPQTLNTKN